MHLFNNYLGIGLPESALTIPFGVLFMRNYAANIPDELIEAAIMDQAGHFQIFRRVFIPLARPAIANLTVLCFMWSLQDFLWPSIFISNPDMTTAAQAVETFQNSLSASPLDIARYSAGLVLLAVPAILLVTFGMRFITSGPDQRRGQGVRTSHGVNGEKEQSGSDDKPCSDATAFRPSRLPYRGGGARCRREVRPGGIRADVC
jgi:ABC-type maltose transport system permease subunit